VPEPEPLPDEPPTGPWDDVPPPPDDAPALEPIGERVVLDDEADSGGQPVLVWNGDGWGVAWGGSHWSSPGRLAILDRDGRLLHRVSYDSGVRAAYALDFAIGRYALVSAGGRGATFDRNATPASSWSRFPAVGDSVDVARFPIAHGWLVATGANGGGSDEDTVLHAFTLDDELGPSGSPDVVLGPSMGAVRIGTAKTRALVAWPTRTGIRGQVLIGAALETNGDVLDVLDLPLVSDSGLEIELFRDRLVVGAVGSRDIRMRIVDPFSTAPLTTPPIVVARGRIGDRPPAIAVAPEHGFFVACFATGPDAPGPGVEMNTGVALQVVGADGSLWGTRVELVEGERNVGGVSCGWSGEDIVVIWWRASGDGAFNTMFSERARPTFL
jgi:hypothetical protein